MKRLSVFYVFLIVVCALLCVCFVSCSDSSSAPVNKLCSVGFKSHQFNDGNNSKALTFVSDFVLGESVDTLYWQYEAIKTDSYETTGQTEGRKNFSSDTGLKDLEGLSAGKWIFKLYAYKDAECTKELYNGTTEEVNLLPSEDNSVTVQMQRSRITGQKGFLKIDKRNLTIASDKAGTTTVVYSSNTETHQYIDTNAKGEIFGKLEDYSFTVYRTSETGAILEDITSATTGTLGYESEPVSLNIMVKCFKDNEAVYYIAPLVVEIYSNSTTTVQDKRDSARPGLEAKHVKEFNISYRDCGNTEFSGEHEVNFPVRHQYGRVELLDKPFKAGYSFEGYYDNPEGEGKALSVVKAFVYTDTVLYAKWGQKNYKTITWNDNGATTAHIGGSTSGTSVDNFALPATDPVRTGYTFLGWYDAEEGGTQITEENFPLPENTDLEITFYAHWKANKYSVVFTDGGVACTLPSNLNNVEYDTEIELPEPTGASDIFLGWKYTPDGGTEKIIFGAVKNLKATAGTVTLTALWGGTYFDKLEYVRTTANQYIDTGIKAKDASYAEMETEWAVEDYENQVMLGADSSVFVLNEETGKWENSSTTGDMNLYLFAQNKTGTVANKANARLYSCTIYSADKTALRSFIPCKLKKNLTATECADGLTHSTNEVGFWDKVSNKFYARASGSQSFYVPTDEVVITFKANYAGSELADMKQKILKNNLNEKLFKNQFSNQNSTFLGWGNATDSPVNDYDDGARISISTDKVLYARWSNPVNYELFGQVEWIQGYGKEYIQTGIKATKNRRFKFKGILNRAGTVNNYGCLVSMEWRYHGNRANFFSFLFRRNVGTDLLQLNCLGINRYDGVKDYVAWDSTSWTNSGLPTTMDGTTQPYELSCTFGEETMDLMVVLEDGTIVANGSVEYRSSALMDWDGGDTVVFGRALFAHAIAYGGNPVGYTPSEIDQNNNSIVYATYVDGSRDLGCGRLYYVVLDDGVSTTFVNLVPAVLNVDLTSRTSYAVAGTGIPKAGNKFVYGEVDCYQGDAGFWDLVSNRFFPNQSPTGTGALGYPTSEYRIRYDGNGGYGLMDTQIINNIESTVRLLKCTFRKDGAEFIGWNTQPNGTGKWYSDERLLSNSEYMNTTLFAQWKLIDSTRSAYCEDLEYIVNDNDGSAYIDTGLKLTSTDMRILYTYAKKNVVDTNLLGSKDSVYSYNHGNMNGRDLCVGSAKFDVGNVLLDKKYNVEVSSFNGYLYYRHWGNGLDVSNSLATTIKAGDNTEYLFGVHTAGGLEKAKGVALYSVKYYDASDRLVRDFVPVILKTTLPSGYDSKGVERQANTIGMWDNVNNKFYANAASSGAFACSAYTSVVYNANGGRGTMDNQMFANNESHTLSANAFTRTGYSFVGWNTDKDGNGRWYCNGYSSDSWDGGALTLYAQWVSNDTISSEYFDVVSGVKSSGKEYIDLGFRPDASSSAVVTYGLDTECDDVIFGYSNASNSYRLYNKDGKVFFDINGTEISHSNNYNTGYMYSFEIGNFYLYSGDNPLASRDSLESFTANDNCYLFKGKSSNSTETLYALKVYQNGILIRNLVPCRLKQDISVYDAAYRAADQSVHYTGEIGFWDFADDVFYGNDSGRGSLLAK